MDESTTSSNKMSGNSLLPIATPESTDLSSKLIQAGLPLKGTVDPHAEKVKQARQLRKEKFANIMKEFDDSEKSKVTQEQNTLLKCWNMANNTPTPSVPTPIPTVSGQAPPVSHVFTQFTQPSQFSHPFSEEFPTKAGLKCEFLPDDDESIPESFLPRNPITNECSPKYKFCSSFTKTVEQKVEIYDLTNETSSDDDEKKKVYKKAKNENVNKVKVKKEKENIKVCPQCGSVPCHNTLFGNFCFANVQRYFTDDKLLANQHQAQKVYVKAYNSALDVHKYKTTSRLLDYEVVFPPTCMNQKSLSLSMKWFDRNKDQYTTYIRSSRVASKRIRARANLDKELAEYEVRKNKWNR